MAEKDSFGRELSKIHPLIVREFARKQHDIFSKTFLTIPQMLILEFLDERTSCKMSELAQALGCTMSAATAVINKMIKLKLVKRDRSEKDRRVVNVVVSKKGKDVIGSLKKDRQAFLSSFFSILSEKDKVEYLRILRKIYNHLVAKR